MSPAPGRTRRAACTGPTWSRARCSWASTGSGTAGSRRGWTSPGWRMSTGWPPGKPMLLYLKRPAPDQEPRLTAMIDGIRAAGTVSYRTFATPRELERLLADDLAVLLSESFAGAAAGTGAPAGRGRAGRGGAAGRDGHVPADRYRGVDAAVGDRAGGDGGGAGAARPSAHRGDRRAWRGGGHLPRGG